MAGKVNGRKLWSQWQGLPELKRLKRRIRLTCKLSCIMACILLAGSLGGCGSEKAAEGGVSEKNSSEGRSVADIMEEAEKGDSKKSEGSAQTEAGRETGSGAGTEAGGETGSGAGTEAGGESGNDTENGENQSGESDVIDLTQMSSTFVYAEVYSMMRMPYDYDGKTVKMKGKLAVYDGLSEEQAHYYSVIIADATQCCEQGIEFVLANGATDPSQYPEAGTEVCVTGIFKAYGETGGQFGRLESAELTVE